MDTLGRVRRPLLAHQLLVVQASWMVHLLVEGRSNGYFGSMSQSKHLKVPQ